MRYDTEEALRKTLERASALRKRRSRRRELALSVGSGGCLCALLVLVYELAARGAALAEADYGAFLLPSRAGSYILAGVLAFTAGVLVTLACLRGRNGGASFGGPRGDHGGEEEEEKPEKNRKG